MKRIAVALVLAILCAMSIGVAVGAATNSLSLRAGNSEAITCPNALTNTNVGAKSETVNCAKNVTTTTTKPTTTTAPTTTVAPTTTTAPTGPTGPAGTCTSPIATISDPEGTVNIDPNGGEYWWVNNDAWNGSHGPQTVYVCNQQSWYAVSNQPNVGGAVEAAPQTEYDIGGRNGCANQCDETTTIADYSGGSITSTYADIAPAAGSWDEAYDLWTNYWTNETMVWTSWAGGQAYWADCAASGNSESYCGHPQSGAVTLGGVGYHWLANGPTDADCTTANEADCEVMLFQDNQTTSGSANLLAVFQWEVSAGLAKATDIPMELEYTVEIAATNGPETFYQTGLTFSVTP